MKRGSVAFCVTMALAAVSGGCSHGGTSNGACSRIIGGWAGDGVVADGGQDPEAIRTVSDVMREEHWRITRVIPIALQRERGLLQLELYRGS